MRRPGSILAALFAAGVLASVGFVAPGATAARTGPVPKVVLIVGPARQRHQRLSRRGPSGRGGRPEVHARRDRDLLAQRHVAGGQGRAPGRVAGRLHGPRQRLAQPVPRRAVPADPERLRPQPVRRRAATTRISTSGRSGSRGGQAREGRGRAPAPPLLRERQLSEPGLPEGTLDDAQQRIDNFASRLHRGAGASAVIAEAYASPSGYVKAILGGEVDRRLDLADAPSANGNGRSRSRAPATRATSGRWTPRRELRLRALDRPEGRARARGRPRRRPRDRQRAGADRPRHVQPARHRPELRARRASRSRPRRARPPS